jgi:predicted RNA-binding protein YlqC (UPF0109 family)
MLQLGRQINADGRGGIMQSIDQQFIEYIVKSLVGHPDDVVVDRIIDEKGVLLSLTVNPDDLGRVIGKRGATAQSLRTLLRALGTKNDARYNLKIVNNDDDRENYTISSTDKTDQVVEEIQAPATGVDDTESVENQVEDTESDYTKKSRKELAELDDLDI